MRKRRSMRASPQRAANKPAKQRTFLRWKNFARSLLDKAQIFYNNLLQKNASDSALRIEQAQAHSRLGDINRLMGRYQDAALEYNKSISSFEALEKQYPTRNELRQSLAYSHNWLGETIRDALASGDAIQLIRSR